MLNKATKIVIVKDWVNKQDSAHKLFITFKKKENTSSVNFSFLYQLNDIYCIYLREFLSYAGFSSLNVIKPVLSVHHRSVPSPVDQNTQP